MAEVRYETVYSCSWHSFHSGTCKSSHCLARDVFFSYGWISRRCCAVMLRRLWEVLEWFCGPITHRSQDRARKNIENEDTQTSFSSRGELGSVGVPISEDDMVSLALLVLPKRWHSYWESVNGREKLPDWERLWSDLVQDEFRLNTKDGTSSKEVEEEFSLVIKENKAKGKKS